MADSKKYNGSTWEHSLRKLTTAIEAVENPLYSDGTAITAYTLKGNTIQNGTPTPSNPVEVNGVGVRTENLFDGADPITGLVNAVTGAVNTGNTNYITTNLRIFPAGTYTISLYNPYVQTARNTSTRICTYSNGVFDECLLNDNERNVDYSASFTLTQERQVRISVRNTDENIMLNTGSTTKPYEPYGYKIPISSGGVTTNIYLGSTQTTRQIGKYIFDGSNIFTTQRSAYRNNTALFATTVMTGTGITNRPSINNYFVVPSSGTNPQSLDYACSGFHPFDQYSSFYYLRVPYDVIGMTDSNTDNEFITALNTWLSSLYNSGNPMIAYYVLATPETAAVNEPLMKIGDYADTLSNAVSIPTTEGANSITVDTTVQPSEFTATWTGWHDANVKEWDGTEWS